MSVAFPARFPAHFNSRPSARGDGGLRVRLHRWRRFQFTPLREGRHVSRSASPAALPFQFTPLREGRLRGVRESGRRENFNSRPSARGDGAVLRVVFLPFVFQFTPLREGRRNALINAHTRGTYFNSRPSARGDPPAFRCVPQAQNFNSRPSARGDTTGLDGLITKISISIHAPPRGATRCSRRSFGLMGYFNSRPSARGDSQKNLKTPLTMYFNSRPSARGDVRAFS